MKKYYSHVLIITAITLTTTSIAFAQEDNRPPMPRPGALGQQLRQNFGERFEGMRNNEGSRNNMLDRDTASTTRKENREERTEKREERRGLRMEEFKSRKEIVLQQMNRALENLGQIRTRISSRIEKEQSAGVNMSEAITLLTIADQKIALASTSVSALSAYIPNASSTASTTIDIQTARDLTQTARKALDDARRSLGDVVRAIAHAMGLDLGNEKSDEPSTTTSPQ